MFHKILLLLITILLQFNLPIVSAQSSTNVELFDIEKGEVIKTPPTNDKIQVEVEKLIKDIDDVFKKIRPIPDKGYMIKIPLEPSFLLENQWLYAQVDEVIIIIPKNEKPIVPEDNDPYLLIFDDENKAYFFTFKTKIDPLLNILNFSL